MLRNRSFRSLLVGFAFCRVVSHLFGQTRTYGTKQISSGAFNHESPSINNAGDVVWTQQVGGFWQVYLLRVGSTTPAAPAGQAPDHNNTYPVIDDGGNVMYLKDGVGQGVARAVTLNNGGTESTIEFSSRNNLTGDHRMRDSTSASRVTERRSLIMISSSLGQGSAVSMWVALVSFQVISPETTSPI